jgi:hypothetical protein
MARTPYSLNSYTGGAGAAYLTGSGIGATDTTITITGTTAGWSPLGAVGGWYLSLDYATANEEKVYVPSGSYSWSSGQVTMSGIQRGFETSAVVHSGGALCTPVITATDSSEANEIASILLGNNPVAVSGYTVGGTLTANSLLQVNHRVALQITTISGTYTTNAADIWVRVISGTETLTLTSYTGGLIFVTNEGTGIITVSGSSGTLIGANTLISGSSAIYLNNGTNWETVAGYSTPGGLLSITQYAPVGATTYNLTTSGFAPLDTTNLANTFIAPSSGRVLIRLSAFVNDAGAEAVWFGLINASGGAVIGPTSSAMTSSFSGKQFTTTTTHLVTGLTPGASYTFYFAVCASALTSTPTIVAGTAGGSTTVNPSSTSVGPATIEVFSA